MHITAYFILFFTFQPYKTLLEGSRIANLYRLCAYCIVRGLCITRLLTSNVKVTKEKELFNKLYLINVENIK